MSGLLVQAGFPKDYLTPHYVCPKCKDTGYIGNEKCSCFIQASIDLLYRESNITRYSSNETFDNFSLDFYSTEFTDPSTGLNSVIMPKAYCLNARILYSIFLPEIIYFFYGDTGVGKTFLSNCIARALLDNAHSVLYMSAIELFDSFSAYNEDDGGMQSQIEECELLIIDDLGTELSNTFTNSKLFHCINSRLLGGRSTIISTNFALNELMDAYSERIFSRISSSYKLLKLYGDDIRFIKKEITHYYGGASLCNCMKTILKLSVGSLGLITLKGCEALGAKINDYIVDWRNERENEHKTTIAFSGYQRDNYIVKTSVPRFGSGGQRV